MTHYNYIFFVIFVVLATMITLDNNIATYFTLIFKFLRINLERVFWLIRFHPNNFVTTWIMNRKYDRIAKELEKEFNQK